MNRLSLFRLFPLYISFAAAAAGGAVPLFDGRTLDGWEGDTNKVWRIENGAIVGGSMDGNPQNEFLATKKSYRNFILRFDYKLVGTEGFVNGGVQFRSKRLAQPPNEMSGYQADIGPLKSGNLYDESRRRKTLVEGNRDLVAKVEKSGDWNHLEIRALENNIVLLLNGTTTVDYTETEADIERNGVIALQIHGDNKAVVSYRNIVIEALADDVVPVEKEILNRFGNPNSPAVTLPAFNQGQFSIEQNETIVFTGQTNFVREQKAGELEAILAHAYAANSPRFRSMAWEGDTVYEQWRDLNFGAWKAQLDAVSASIVVAQFGQVEAFDGVAKLPQFTSAYQQLLDQFASRTPRLVLISPMPFEKPVASHAPDLTQRNADVKVYADAVRDIAKQRGVVFIDLFTPLSKRDASLPRLTDNGLHLNETGLREVAKIIAQQLGASSSEADDLSALRTAIVEKNRLFFDAWRPANWSFVYGSRVTQMFGKSSEDAPSLKESFEARKPLVAKLDANIHAIARGEKIAPIVSSPPKLVQTPAVVSAAEELASFTVAEGYEVNLFASEELGLAKPTQITWDERGRMLVACSPTYPQTVPGVKPSDYILVLEDTNHDGKAETSHRFAEGLTMVTGLEPGEGGLYVCDFDQIIHLRDTDGDGIADTKRVLFGGFGIADTHQLINSITHGPDGSLWFSQGTHIFSRVETAHGLAVLQRGGIARLNLRTQKLEGFFNGGMAGHNIWGIAFDDYNQVFHKGCDRPEGYYSVPGLVSIPDPDEYHGIGNLFFTNPKTTSLDFIGTRALPDNIQGCALIGGYFGNVVELHRLSDDGAGFKSEQLPKLMTSSTTAFRPVDVSVGPDGAIYIADWFNPIIGHYQASYADPQRDRTHGRIWRISAKGRPSVKQPDLAAMKPADLLKQLRSPERWTRYQAKRLLFDAPSADVLKSADEFVAKTTDEHMLMEVCGVFEAHESPCPALLAKLLAAKDPRVRAYGARVVGNWADRLPEALTLLGKSIHDEHPRVRLESTVACAHVAKPEAITIAVQALDSPRDQFIDYALTQVTKALKPRFLPMIDQLKLSNTQLAFVKKIADAVPVVEHPGKTIYDSLCLNCHQPTGLGLPGIYPSLSGSDWVAGDVTTLSRILIHGLTGPIKVNGQDFKQAAPIPMPPMGLNDQQVADVLTYIRSNFANNAPAVKPDEVKAVREENGTRDGFWTQEELSKDKN
jgi:glucose/arabinose dehydrogenase/mono/diheme cytochrome c family protein